MHLEHLHQFSKILLQLVAVFSLKRKVTLYYAGRSTGLGITNSESHLCHAPAMTFGKVTLKLGKKKGHILNLTSSGEACVMALQTQRPKVTTKDVLKLKLIN